MPPNYFDIRYFLEVAQTGNISRAAERLGITQPSLSAALKRLEDSLGVRLFVRGRTGVRLTKSGMELQGRGRMFITTWEQLKSDVNKKESAVSGQYRIGCHPSVAMYSLGQFLPQLMVKHQDLDIEIVHDLSRKITERVISYEIDFGIVVNPVRHPDLVIKELCRDEVGFWVSKHSGNTQSLKEGSAILVCDSELIQVQKLRVDAFKKGLRFKRVVTSGNLEVIAELTASGLGVGVLPRRVALNSLKRPLKELPGKWPIFKDRICVVYRADLQRTLGSQVILNYIRENVV